MEDAVREGPCHVVVVARGVEIRNPSASASGNLEQRISPVPIFGALLGVVQRPTLGVLNHYCYHIFVPHCSQNQYEVRVVQLNTQHDLVPELVHRFFSNLNNRLDGHWLILVLGLVDLAVRPGPQAPLHDGHLAARNADQSHDIHVHEVVLG